MLRFSVFEDALAKNHTLGFLGFVFEEAIAKHAALGFLCLSLGFLGGPLFEEALAGNHFLGFLAPLGD